MKSTRLSIIVMVFLVLLIFIKQSKSELKTVDVIRNHEFTYVKPVDYSMDTLLSIERRIYYENLFNASKE